MTKRAKRAPYTRERKAEALALARIAGAEVASDRSRIPVQTIRRWMDAAGVVAGTDLPQERLEALRDLAEASVTRDLVDGRIRGVQAMTVAGIARRHIAKPSPPLGDPAASAVSARETFLDWLVETVVPEPLSEEALNATAEAIDDVVPMLLRRANAETPEGVANDDRQSTWESNPHRHALLAWFSGRPEVEAGDILEWSKTVVLDVLATHGSLASWHAWQQAEDAREKAARDAIGAAAAAKGKAAAAASRQAMLDTETKALLAAAEAYLRSDPSEVNP